MLSTDQQLRYARHLTLQGFGVCPILKGDISHGLPRIGDCFESV
jgi:hypothetical protein